MAENRFIPLNLNRAAYMLDKVASNFNLAVKCNAFWPPDFQKRENSIHSTLPGFFCCCESVEEKWVR